jgi:hypothetical protein
MGKSGEMYLALQEAEALKSVTNLKEEPVASVQKKIRKRDLLSAPMPYKWRVQSFSKNKPVASCVAYIDARDVMKRLDDVVGPDGWQRMYKKVDDLIVCALGLRDSNGQWIFKEDVGAEGSIEAEKSIISDAFKRAAVNWGVGRFLYDLDIQYVKTNGIKGDVDSATHKRFPQVIDDDGKIVYDLTEFINKKTGANR